LAQFASMTAHDLQELQRMVVSFVSLLQRKYAAQLDERTRDFIAQSVNGTERMRPAHQRTAGIFAGRSPSCGSTFRFSIPDSPQA